RACLRFPAAGRRALPGRARAQGSGGLEVQSARAQGGGRGDPARAGPGPLRSPRHRRWLVEPARAHVDRHPARHPLCRRHGVPACARARPVYLLLARGGALGRRRFSGGGGQRRRRAAICVDHESGGTIMSAAPNPLRAGLHEERLPEPCTMVIFGASGDLTRRKLMPAIYSLARDRLLPPNLAVVGVARKPISDPDFRKSMRAGCDEFARRRPVDPQLWQSFESGIFYHQGDFDDATAYERLKKRLGEIDQQRGIAGNRVFYLATPPEAFPKIIACLGAGGLVNRKSERPFTRIIVEKPFGTDLASARALNREVTQVADESQIYRIDHYLGKETVQNLLVFRFANGIFEPLWNQKYVDHVQITGAEAIGIEGRG